ncbi:MAG: GPP34 family phosphoprotein [Microbacterium sp.]
MLTVEELYLLLTRESGEREVSGLDHGPGLSAALLADLLIAGRIAVTDDHPPRITVLSTEPTGTLLIDYGLELIESRNGRTLESAMRWGRFTPSAAVVASLVDAGVITRGTRRMGGFGSLRTPLIDPTPKQAIRDRLAAVFAGHREPTAQDATLVAVLQALTVAPQLLHELVVATSRPDLERRIQAVVDAAPMPAAAVARTASTMVLARTPGVASAGPYLGPVGGAG